MKSLSTQIVIPVHDLTRPVSRAVKSVLDDEYSGVVVVGHNLDPADLDLPPDDRIVTVQANGHAGKPGFPFDTGIAAASADWLGIMGSDDWFQPGALKRMRDHLARDRADVVIAPLSYQGGGRSAGPLTPRQTNLRAAKDRLFYRTAPLGLIRSDILQDPFFAFTERYFSGEDLRASVRLWTSGLSVSFFRGDPGYVVGADAKQRTTLVRRPLADQGAAWLAIWDDPHVSSLAAAERHSLAVKIARVHVLGAMNARSEKADWTDEDFEWLAGLMRRLANEDSRVLAPFRAATARTLSALLAGDQDEALRNQALEDSSGLRDRLLPQNLFNVFERDSNVRWSLASAHVNRLSFGK